MWAIHHEGIETRSGPGPTPLWAWNLVTCWLQFPGELCTNESHLKHILGGDLCRGAKLETTAISLTTVAGDLEMLRNHKAQIWGRFALPTETLFVL